ncbi:hypothetical protein [Aestuariivivens insulae]|uniref:hypothetical protein n=1 Tax=Aestuariivivens insulae TaxID=1621988 RepID=UPI001F5820F2|nr:hypothetical protein [Aestuariivivens insulae]
MSYILSLENNPLLFMNQLINTHINVGQKVPLCNSDFDILIENLGVLVETYNTHLPNTKFINRDKLDIILDSCYGDVPLFIMMMYLADVDDDIIPMLLVNINELYAIIQQSYNQIVNEDSKSKYGSDVNFIVVSILEELRA